MDIDKAVATQLANIEKRTGKTLAQLAKIVTGSGLTKHGELVAMLKADLGMGHGDANTLVHTCSSPTAPRRRPPAAADRRTSIDEIYTGPKAALRPDPRRLDGRHHEVRPVRDRAEEGLRQPARQEAVRDDRPGHQRRGSRSAST